MPKYKISAERIDRLDERWYALSKDAQIKHVPSVTTIIEDGSGFPYGLAEWYKQHGMTSDYLLEISGHIGSEVHKLIEKTLKNEEVSIDDVVGAEGLKAHIWERYMRWCAFWYDLNNKHKVDYLPNSIEFIAYDFDLGYAGTVDFMATVDDEPTIFDWKTGKYIYPSSKIQIATYAKTLNVVFGTNIKECRIVHIPPVKSNKQGYTVTTVDKIDERYNHFLAMLNLYKLNHESEKPKFLSFPTKITNSQIIKTKIEV